MAFSSQTQPLRVRLVLCGRGKLPIWVVWTWSVFCCSVMDLFLPNLLRDLEGVLMPLRLKIGIHSCINDEQAWSAFCSPGLVGARSAGVRASIADAPKLFAIAEKSTFGNFTMSVR
jgi:hypothetical protein